MALTPYLFFNGNCEEAMQFYAGAVDNSSIESIQRFGQSGMEVSEEHKNRVIHAIMKIQGTPVMFSDTDGKQVIVGQNFSLALDFNGDEEMDRVFAALSAGGDVTMPLQDTFWGAKFGMCTDKYGVNWMFNFDKAQPESHS